MFVSMIVAVATMMAMSTSVTNVAAWMPHTPAVANNNNSRLQQQEQLQLQQRQSSMCPQSSVRLFMAGGDEVAAEETETTAASSSTSLSFLEQTEWNTIQDLHDKASKKAADANGNTATDDDDDSDSEEAFQKAAEELLPALSPALIMKLRNGKELLATTDDDDDDDNNKILLNIFSDVSRALNTMTDRRLESARDTLEQLMNAGEIKKLDALIGKSAREQRLDVAFFQVLQMNLRDAAEESQKAATSGDNNGAVDRFQILQHVYTRCQEEVEKTINPGTALLNKLLRTEVDSIRRNQLDHYLCPAPTTITSPDGKEITLASSSNAKSLVAHPDFCTAMGNAVQQIRTVERSGATTPEVAADLVESIRTVAKEARIVIGEHFGGDSKQLLEFQDALEPVFRPTSPDSPYIRGQQQE